MFTHRCFFYTHTYQTETHCHTRKHTVALSVFHRQITSIRDSSPCCHDNDYIYPKHGFLSSNLLCPPPHPLGEGFQHNAWDCNQRNNITRGQLIKSDTRGEPGVHRERPLTTTDQTQTRETKSANFYELSSEDIIPVTSI